VGQRPFLSVLDSPQAADYRASVLDEKRRATLARLARWAEVLAPVLLSAVAFGGITRVAFHLDDHVHLYDIVNLGPQSILINFAGHLYLTRNTVLLLLHALFGMNTPATMTVVLLNHLLAVALMVIVIRTLTGNGAVGSVVAAWWGASAMNIETLAWYSVYGQVLAITALLCVLLLAARVSRGDPLGAPAAVAAALALIAAASSFGTGLAISLAMPVGLWVMLPASPGRARLVRAAAIAAVVIVVLYVVTDRLNREIFGHSSIVMPGATRQWFNSLVGLAHLLLSGVAVATAGPWYLPLHALGGWAKAVVLAAAVALLATARSRWRAIAGCLLLSAAPYGLIAISRYGIVDSAAAEAALSDRYHYVSPLGAFLALAIAIAALLGRARNRRRADAAFAATGYAVAVAGYLCCFPPMPTHVAVQRQVDTILKQTIATIRAHPPGDVYIRQRPFFTSDLTSLTIGDTVINIPPGRFPGSPALYALYHDEDVFEGRRVYFVVGDPAKVAAWRRGRRGSQLILSWQEMLERTGRAAAPDDQSPSSGGAAPSTPR
jgi:hypothetical protein